MSDNRQHHEMSFSQWPMIAQCNGFISGKFENKDTEKGQSIHDESQDCYLRGQGDYSDTAFWASEWLRLNEDGEQWIVEDFVKIVDCGLLTGIGGYPDFCQVKIDRIRVADLKSFSDGSKDSFSQLAGYALAIATKKGLSLETPCELTVLHGLVKRAETRFYSVSECLDIATDIYKRRNESGNLHTICDSCKFCGRSTDGTCNAQGAIVEATKIEMAVTFPVSQEQLTANSVLSAKVAVIAKAGVKFWERQFDMCKESAKANGGIIDDGEGCKYAFKTINGKRICKDLLSLVARLNDEGVHNEEIIAKVDLSLTSLRELLTGIDKKKVKEIEEVYFISEGTIEKFERVTK